MDNKNTAPERIELPGGWAFVQLGRENVGLYKLDIPDVRDTHLVFEKQSALKYAAAMQSVPSESDDAVAREIVNKVMSFPSSVQISPVAAILARYRQTAILNNKSSGV